MNQGRLEDLLQDVAARAAQQAEPEQRSLRPPVSTADLDLAVEQLGFRLHPLLRRLYSKIADGGFGPEYSRGNAIAQRQRPLRASPAWSLLKSRDA